MSQWFRVLFFDSVTHRHNQFRIVARTAGKYSIVQKHAYKTADFIDLLKFEPPFDVIFFPLFCKGYGYPYQTEMQEVDKAVNFVCALSSFKKPRLIIMHGLGDDFKVIPRFRKAGIPTVHKPFQKGINGNPFWKLLTERNRNLTNEQV